MRVSSVTIAGLLVAALGVILIIVVGNSWSWVIAVGVVIAAVGAFMGRGRSTS